MLFFDMDACVNTASVCSPFVAVLVMHIRLDEIKWH